MDNIEQTQPALQYLEPLSLLRNVNGRFEMFRDNPAKPSGFPLPPEVLRSATWIMMVYGRRG